MQFLIELLHTSFGRHQGWKSVLKPWSVIATSVATFVFKNVLMEIQLIYISE